jgi:peroxiredoxin
MLAASVDPVDKAKAMAERTGATFTILSDEKGQLIEYFNIWHRRPEKTDISIASSFLFTQKGELIWQNITDNHKIRPKPEEILAAAEAYRKAVEK